MQLKENPIAFVYFFSSPFLQKSDLKCNLPILEGVLCKTGCTIVIYVCCTAATHVSCSMSTNK
ncbi:hypothetical protein DAI22_06g250100 [Oryza sativa Japonica Group]|nr:hypothetical protein DAI22_06g250100 [Oryza sativa Japonica Group]